MSEDQIKIVPLEQDININAGRIAEHYRQTSKEIKFQSFLEDLLVPNSVPGLALIPLFCLNTFSLYCTLFTWNNHQVAFSALLIFLGILFGISCHICFRTKFKLFLHLFYYWFPICSGILLGVSTTIFQGGKG